MIIAIPTYNRYDQISNYTLKFLNENYIHPDDIYLFVVEEEKELYQKLGDYNVIVGKKGISEQRKFMATYFNEGCYICYMDDDIIEMKTLKKEFKLIEFLFEAEELMKKENCGLLGVYPVDNEYFLKKGYTTDLKFVIGAFCVVKNTRDCEQRQYVMLEDYQRTLNYYKYYKKVIRYNDIIVRHKINSNKGGIQSFYNKKERIKTKSIEIKRFLTQYPNYAKERIKKNGSDILLNKNHVIELESYRYDHNTLTTLWINEPNELFKLALFSWLKLGYTIIIYTNSLTIDKIKKMITTLPTGNLNTIIFQIIKDENIENILRFSDLFRFKLLNNNNHTWIDADMVLLNRIPHESYIISSEYTNQSGAFKSKQKKIANIGLLRLPKNDYLLKEVIKKIEAKKEFKSDLDNMVIFRETLKKPRFVNYNRYVAEPHEYCPVNWSFCKEIYYNDEEELKQFQKYGVGIYENWKKSVGVHMWNNFSYNKHKIDFNKIHPKSIYAWLSKQ